MAASLAADNPFRYRGYYYDNETGLYYLNARYYNPGWGRFINADSYGGSTGQLLSHNVFAYCSNNPVMASDSSGNFWYYGNTQCSSSTSFKKVVEKINCYGYALGLSRSVQPGKIANPKSSFTNKKTVYEVADIAMKDLDKIGGRCLGVGQEGLDAQIGDNEYMIALRINKGDNPLHVGVNPFHFIKRERDGKWFEKPGTGQSNPEVLPLSDGFNPEGQWGTGYWNSKTIYFAVPYNHEG